MTDESILLTRARNPDPKAQVRRHPNISFVINETHYFDNGEELLIDPMNDFLISGAFRYRNRIAYTSLIKGFKLETVAGTIK